MRRTGHGSVLFPSTRRGLIVAASLSAAMALSPAMALADEYGIDNTQAEAAPVVQAEPALEASSEVPATNPGYAPSQTDVVPTQGQPGFTPSQVTPSPVVNNPTPNGDAPAGGTTDGTEQRPIATTPAEPVKAVTPYDQLTEGLSQRAKNVVTKFFNAKEDPNYSYDQFKREAKDIAMTEMLYKRVPWLMSANPRKMAMQNVKRIALRAVLVGNNSISRRLKEDKSFDFNWVLNGVVGS